MRVLFLTHRLPYAPNRGDRARAHHIVRFLAPRVELEVFSLVHDAHEAEQAEHVGALGARVSVFRVPHWTNRVRAVLHLPSSRPLTHLLLDAPEIVPALERLVDDRPPDVVLAYCSSMARFGMIPPLDRHPLVIDLIDVDSAKWAALATQDRWPLTWIYQREARQLSKFEHLAAMRARHTLVVNHREARLLEAIAPKASIAIVPNGVDVAGLTPVGPPQDAPNLVFCGVMNYAPNVEGVLWFVREVWPLVRARRPDARFVVVGSDPDERIRRIAHGGSGVVVTGTVPDVRDHLWRSAVSLAPLKTARGVQNKVLEAVAAGLPAVVTSQVFEGLPRSVKPACRMADAAKQFADETLSLLALSGAQRRALAARADLSTLSWETQLTPLSGILAAAAQSER